MRILFSAVIMLPLLLSTCSRTNPDDAIGNSKGQECLVNADCQGGLRCINEICQEFCLTDMDCQLKTDECDQNICIPVENPTCSVDEDCINLSTPPACQTRTNSGCYGGRCQFGYLEQGTICNDSNDCTTDDYCDGMGNCNGTVKSCITPPQDQCVNDDQTFVTYANPGYCNTETGSCEYKAESISCTDCRQNCLQVCESLNCYTELNCQESYCNALLEPPECEIQPADISTPCFLEGEIDAKRGYCLAGDCVQCIVSPDCKYPPGHALCFSAQCLANNCQYNVLVDNTCEEQVCINGYLTYKHVCAANGDCVGTGGTSCNGLDCNLEGTACLEYCNIDSQCQEGYYCDANSDCMPRHNNGIACNAIYSGRDCLSGFCNNGYCCGSGLCCSENADCTSLDAPSVCNRPSQCQGYRLAGICTAVKNCDAQTEEDDSGCDSSIVGDECQVTFENDFIDYRCLGTEDQPSPSCFTSCGIGAQEDDSKCNEDPVRDCDPDTGLCRIPPGPGDCCNDPVNCAGADCDASVSPPIACGDSQVPSVYVCCRTGETCCEDDLYCKDYVDPAYRCNTSIYSCRTECTNDSDSHCQSGYHCNATGSDDGQCVPDLADGTACVENSDCQSTYCVDGFCCDSACNTTICQRCDSSSHLGVGNCGYINTGSTNMDPNNECSVGTNATNGCRLGTCSGTGYTCAVQTSSSDGNCPACKTCDGTNIACIDYADHVQDTTGTNKCEAVCYECNAGSCVTQSAGEDRFNHCPDSLGSNTDCADSVCNDSGACDHLTGQQGCPQCYYCNGSNYTCQDATTTWGSGEYGCTNSYERCYQGICHACVDGDSMFLSADNCSGGNCPNQGGQVCWRLAPAGESCENFCLSYGNCDSNDWNDDTTCSVCSYFLGNPTELTLCEKYLYSTSDPVLVYSNDVCFYRNSTTTQSCSNPPNDAAMQRMCVCQY